MPRIVPGVDSIVKGERPVRPPGPSGSRARRWLAAAVLPVLFFSCGQAEPALEEMTAATVAGRVRVFLIATGDDGRSGTKVGCGDSAVPVEVNLPKPGPALEGAIRALLDMHDRSDPTSGLYNALYASRLTVKSVTRAGTQARVDLGGYLELGGECDDPRILAQLQETVLQFPDVEQVTFYLDGKPLQQLVSGRG